MNDTYYISATKRGEEGEAIVERLLLDLRTEEPKTAAAALRALAEKLDPTQGVHHPMYRGDADKPGSRSIGSGLVFNPSASEPRIRRTTNGPDDPHGTC